MSEGLRRTLRKLNVLSGTLFGVGEEKRESVGQICRCPAEIRIGMCPKKGLQDLRFEPTFSE